MIVGLRVRSRLYSLTSGTWNFNDPTLRLEDMAIGTLFLQLETDLDGGVPTALTDDAGVTVFYPE
jgi:hypothetical protein